MKKIKANWKQLTAGALAVFAVLSLTACANEPQDKKPIEEDPASTEENPWIGWPDFGGEEIVLPEDVWE